MKKRFKNRNLGKRTPQQQTAEYHRVFGGNDQCKCGSMKKFRKCCGNFGIAREFSDRWERDEVKQWQKWHAEGAVSGLPPKPIMDYAERLGIILNEEHRADKERRDAERRANLPSLRAVAASMATIAWSF